MDPEKLKDMHPDQMMQQAQQIWKMLDDMAENDPAAYRKFIDKQMADGKESMKPPKPHMCVQTKIQKPKEGMLFINIHEWMRIPEPKSDEDPIPVMGSVIYKGKDDTGIYDIVNIAFCPKVISEFGIESNLVAERNLLINLGISYVEDQHKLTLSKNFTLLDKQHRYKGTLVKALETLTQKMKNSDKEYEKELGELEKNLGSMAFGAKDSLLNQLSNIGVSDPSTMEQQYVPDDPRIEDVAKEPEITLPGQQSAVKKPGLIEEVGSSTSSLPEPVYELDDREGECRVVTVRLPDVSSVKECDLNISQNDLHLMVEGKYELHLDFSCKIDENNAKAKFSKKSSQLKLTLPFL